MYNLDLENLKVLFNSLSMLENVIFWIRTPDFKQQLYLSPSYEKLYSRSIITMCNEPKTWEDLIYTDDQQECVTTRYDKVANVTPNLLTYRVCKPSGEMLYAKDQSFFLYDDNGQCIAVAGIAENIQQRQWEDIVKNNSSAAMESGISNLFSEVLKNIPSALTESPKEENKHALLIPNGKLFILKDGENSINITKREQQCLELLLEGKSAKQTGNTLYLSPRTVETYIDNLKRKLKCRTKIELIGKLMALKEAALLS